MRLSSDPAPRSSADLPSTPQCDGVHPVCGGCQANATTCTWDRPAQKRGPPTGQRLILERKVRNLEAFLGYLWLTHPSVKTEVESSLGFTRFPQDHDAAEQAFGRWSESEKRAVWQESSAANWLEVRETSPEEDTKALAIARARVKDGTELLPTAKPNQDISVGAYSGPGPRSASSSTYPTSRPPWESVPSWTPSIQHPQSATRTSPVTSAEQPSPSQISPAMPYPQSAGSAPTPADSIAPSTGEARYAPAGDLYGQVGSQRYAGPPSGLYMLRPQASRSPDDTGAESGEHEAPWVHSQIPSPASSEDGDAEAADEVQAELMANGPSPRGAAPIAGASGASVASAPDAKTQAQLTLDDLEELDSLLDVYFTHAHSFLPFVDRTRILRWSSQMRGFSQEPANEVDKPHPALIFALCAVACGFASQPSPYETDLSASFKADQRRHSRLRNGFMSRARELIMPRLGSEASLDVVQTALLLVICDLSLGRDSRAWVWLAIAIRLGQDIGLHRASAGVTKSPFPSSAKGKGPEAQMPPPPQLPDAERRRVTWWTCFSLDTLLSFHLGRPTAIHRSGFECRVPSSEGADEWELCKTPALGGEGTGGDADRVAGTGLPKWGGKLGLKTVRSQTLSGFAAFAELSDILHEIHRLVSPLLLGSSTVADLISAVRSAPARPYASSRRHRRDHQRQAHRLEGEVAGASVSCSRPDDP